MPRLNRRMAGSAEEAVAPAEPAVVALPSLDEAGRVGDRQWNVPPEVADGTPARAARRGRRGALADANLNEPDAEGGGAEDVPEDAAAPAAEPKAAASRRSTRTQRGKENPPAAPAAVKTEPVATRSGRATRKRRA